MLLGIGALITALYFFQRKGGINSTTKATKRGGGGFGGLRSATLAPTNPIEPTTVNVTVNEDDDEEPATNPITPEADIQEERGDSPPPPPPPPPPPNSPQTSKFVGDADDIEEFEAFIS